MRQDILSLLSREKDVTNVIVLTHNIDFVFVQSIVLPALRKCGHPSLTIFADAQCAEESFQVQSLAIDSLGSRFRVVPVAMHPGFRFHPKAIFLSSQQKGTLLVGSGNLTFGGWRENGEIWCSYDTSVDGTGVFAAFREYLADILSLIPLGHNVQAEVEEAFDGKTRPWADIMEPAERLLGRAGKGPSLLDQMQRDVGDLKVNSLTLSSPYFDKDADALHTIAARFNIPVKVAAQKGRSGLNRECAETLKAMVEVNTVNFHHGEEESGRREAFIHAKWYALHAEQTVKVFLGSANCSRAALTLSGNLGNAELMTSRDMSQEAFHELLTGEIEFIHADPELPAYANSEPEHDTANISRLRILAARLEQNILQVAYSRDAGITITKLVVKDNPVEFHMNEKGILFAYGIERDCKTICLEGMSEGNVVLSNLMWVDDEHTLNTTARSRSVAEAIRTKVKSQTWNIGAWAEIADIFYRHLKYMPTKSAAGHYGSAEAGEKPSGVRPYTERDVFSDGYGLPSLAFPIDRISTQLDDRVTSLRQLLFRWFGLKEKEEAEPEVGPPSKLVDDGDSLETVDRPEELPQKPETKNDQLITKPQEVMEKERKRAQEMVRLVTKAMSSDDYLSERQLEMLSIDIQFAAILLRTGLREKWISPEEFFDSTHKIWAAMFFTSKPEICSGWLEYRYKSAGSQKDFVEKLVSARLTAALAAWALAIPRAVRTPEHIRLSLSQVLSVARLPWLWESSDPQNTGEELRDVLMSSTDITDDTFWKEMEKRWVDMMRQGHALKMLEHALEGRSPAELRDVIVQQEVRKGEILWQGTKGFCITVQSGKRSKEEKIPVIYLQTLGNEGKFQGDLTIPMRAILDDATILADAAPRLALRTMIDEISNVSLG